VPAIHATGLLTELSFLHAVDGVRESPAAAGDDQLVPVESDLVD
jgi:hypothetical protein